MADDVTPLPWIGDHTRSLDQQPNPYLIEELERLLEEAKRGLFCGIAYTLERSNGSTANRWIYGRLTHVLIGGVTLLQHRMAEEFEAVSSDSALGPEDPA